jgi:hypothetical protein
MPKPTFPGLPRSISAISAKKSCDNEREYLGKDSEKLGITNHERNYKSERKPFSFFGIH